MRLPLLPMLVEGCSKSVPSVQCPNHRRPVSLSLCGECGHCAELEIDAEGHGAIHCTWPAYAHTPLLDDAITPARPVLCIARVPPLCATPTTRLADVLPHFAVGRFDAVPILDLEAKPVGLVTASEIAGALTRHQASPEARLGALMSPSVRCTSHTPVRQAAQIMTREGVRHLLVTTSRGTMVGIVTPLDLLTALHA